MIPAPQLYALDSPPIGGKPPPPKPPSFSGPNQDVALLFPGPSIDRVWSEDRFGEFKVVVGVNTVAWKYRVHWLVASDHHVFKHVWKDGKIPLVGIVSRNSFAQEALRKGLRLVNPELNGKNVDWKKVRVTVPAGFGQCAYTAPNALYFALKQSGTNGRLEIFGMDFTVKQGDFMGVKGDHRRERWARESKWFRALWNPKIVVHGDIDPKYIAYFLGEANDL